MMTGSSVPHFNSNKLNVADRSSIKSSDLFPIDPFSKFNDTSSIDFVRTNSLFGPNEKGALQTHSAYYQEDSLIDRQLSTQFREAVSDCNGPKVPVFLNQPTPSRNTEDEKSVMNVPSIQNQNIPSRVTALGRNPVSRINSSKIPRPLYKNQRGGITSIGGRQYDSDQYENPSSCSLYTIVDRGPASCRFVRTTLNQIPSPSANIPDTHIPFVLSTQPFANLGILETPVPVVDSIAEDEVIGRCPRCRVYPSAFMKWEDQKNRCICCFCGFSYTLPDDYVQKIRWSSDPDDSDINNNGFAELRKGTVDYVAPPKYDKLIKEQSCKSNPAAYCFVIDTTQASRSTYFTASCIQALKQVFPQFPCDVDVAIITFDDVIKFHSVCSTKISTLVVPDIDNPFIPAPCRNLFLRTGRDLESIITILLGIESAPSPRNNHSVGYAALHSAVELLAQRGGGGTVVFFISRTPNIGLSLSQPLEQNKSGDSEKLPIFEFSQSFSIFLSFALQHSVSIDVFLYPADVPSPTEMYTFGSVACCSGGDLYFCEQFSCPTDYEKLYYDVLDIAQRKSVFKCIVKLRCSIGIEVEAVLARHSICSDLCCLYNIENRTDAATKKKACSSSGDMYETSLLQNYVPSFLKNKSFDPSTFFLPRINPNTSFIFKLKRTAGDDRDRNSGYAQLAILYEDRFGNSLIRVHTFPFLHTSSISNIVRRSDVEPLILYLSTLSAVSLLRGVSTWKSTLLKCLINILCSYRLNAAGSTSSNQLILPESLKLLPLYVSALLKNPVFLGAIKGSLARRISLIFLFIAPPLNQAVEMLYPNIYTFYRTFSKNGSIVSLSENTIRLPSTLPASAENIYNDGMYIIDSSRFLLIYVGEEVASSYLQQFFGISSLKNVTKANELQLRNDTDEAELLRQVINQIRKEKENSQYLPLRFVIERDDTSFDLLMEVLIEDKKGVEPSYVDFLCQLHKKVFEHVEENL